MIVAKTNYENLILQHLFHHPDLTRSEIALQLGIRRNTIGIACEALVRSAVAREQQANRKRNSKLSLEPSAFLSLGVEHRLDSMTIVAMDANRTVVSRFTDSLEEMNPEDRVRGITAELRNALGANGLQKEKVVGIGFSDFIPHNIGTGLKTKSVWMPGWGDINIKALIEDCFGLPVTIMRCTDAFSIAERVFGSCQGEDPFCVLQLDQGIGLAVFRNGMYLKGSTDIFGEIGHTVYREDGEICKCGNRGCLETFAGVGAIIQKVTENITKGLYFKVPDGQASVSLDDIILNAREGNKLALLVLTEAAKAIGDTAANMVNMLGISRIILYGELAKAGELLRMQVSNSIRKHCIYPLNQDAEVGISSLDGFGSATGAAYAVLEDHFREKLLKP
jgi:predicted NBD/HSP70 family sugar kinase